MASWPFRMWGTSSFLTLVGVMAVSYTHIRAHETWCYRVWRILR